MKLIGLTGGIGSGKSTVALMFKALGIPVFIADTVAKSQYENQEVKKEITENFGNDIYQNNTFNKERLAEIVFSQPKALQKLNQIIHPRVHAAFENWLSKQESPYIIYEAALIFELGRQDFFDKIILVTAPKNTKIKRVVERDNVSEAQVIQRMENQWSDEKKVSFADYLIENVSLDQTNQMVIEIDKSLLNSH